MSKQLSVPINLFNFAVKNANRGEKEDNKL